MGEPNTSTSTSANIPRIRFLGGAGTVTGSKYLLTFNERKFLVDCGLFQGLKELRLKNWDRFPIDPKTIEALILTHAHVDHSGYIPRLVQEGFRGKIYCTHATMALCRILLPDTGHLQEEEAQYLGRKRLSKHQKPLPLFTREEAEKCFDYFSPQPFDKMFEALPGVNVTFRYAGHILGAAQAVIQMGQTDITFSGDLGRLSDPLFNPPAKLSQTKYVVVESTYGNRKHPDVDAEEEIRKIVTQVTKKDGVILMPAFTIGRAQTLMYYLSKLRNEKRIPNIPMYLNSPMAESATNIFCEFEDLHKLNRRACNEMCDGFEFVKSAEDSKALNEKKGPMLIISASGMATGGRILHHLRAFASDPNNAIILAGFQAAGTRGRSLQDGAKELKLFGEVVPVRAPVYMFENLSAHADYDEILTLFHASHIHPRRVFVTHGEPEAAAAMKGHIEETFKWDCVVPAQDQEFSLP